VSEKPKENVGLHAKYPFILARFYRALNFLDIFSKNTQVSDLTKILPVGADLFHSDGRTNMANYTLITNLMH